MVSQMMLLQMLRRVQRKVQASRLPARTEVVGSAESEPEVGLCLAEQSRSKFHTLNLVEDFPSSFTFKRSFAKTP